MQSGQSTVVSAKSIAMVPLVPTLQVVAALQNNAFVPRSTLGIWLGSTSAPQRPHLVSICITIADLVIF